VPAKFSASVVFLRGASGWDRGGRALLSQEELAALEETASAWNKEICSRKARGPQKMELPDPLQELASED